jgi:ubiquinone/menaquinone biosynthesis C-methylase UbiE
MEEQELKEIARQLRKPEGEFGLKIGIEMNKSNSVMNKFAIEKLNLSAGNNILEIGMGNGCFVKEILSADQNITYTGADFSDLMVNECKNFNKDWIDKKRASFIKEDASDLPFDDNTFNKILTVNTVYFWDDHRSILKELHRVLKPGGYLLYWV